MFSSWTSYHYTYTKGFGGVSVLMNRGEGPQEEEGCKKLFLNSLANDHDHIIWYETPHSLLRSTYISIGMVNPIVYITCQASSKVPIQSPSC